MAVFRSNKTCGRCGETIAIPIYKTDTDNIGDNFSHWQWLRHNCKGETKQTNPSILSVSMIKWLNNIKHNDT